METARVDFMCQTLLCFLWLCFSFFAIGVLHNFGRVTVKSFGCARWIGHRRYTSCKRRRSRFCTVRCESAFESSDEFANLPCFQCDNFVFGEAQMSENKAETCFPSMRGGAYGSAKTRTKRNNKLLEGLAQLLATCNDDDQEDENSEEDALLHALQSLIHKRPKNLLQELKTLVHNFTPKSDQKDKSWAEVARRKTPRSPISFRPKSDNAKAKQVLTSQLPGRLRTQDWHAKIASTPRELENLAKTEKSLVLAPEKQEDGPEMWALLCAFPDVNATMVLPQMTNLEEYAISPGTISKVDRVPFMIKGALIMQRARLLQKGGTNAPLFAPKEVSLKTDRPKSETVVLRAITHKAFVPDFALVQKNPGSFARKWINSSNVCDSLKIGDTWGWNQEGNRVSGVLRVDLKVAAAILRASGQKHMQTRWFFEPLRYAAPLPPPWHQMPETEWITDNTLTWEKAAALAEQKAVLNDMGVRLGSWNNLGVRKIPSTSDTTPKPKIWKATNVPWFLDVDTVEDVLTEAGFENVQPLEKFRWRDQTGYIFRAKIQEDKDVVHIKYGESEIAVCAQARRTQTRRKTLQLPAEKKVRFARQHKSSFAAGEVIDCEQDDSPTFLPDPDAYTEMGFGTEDIHMNESHKRESSRSPLKAPAKKQKAERKTLPEGLREISNPGAGDCLFWSLSQALEKTSSNPENEKSSLQVRAMCVAHLTKYASSYERHWDGCSPEKGDVAMPQRDFLEYLQRLAQPAAWGSALEITACAMTTDRPIYVYSVGNDSMNTYVFNRSGKRKPLFLKYAPEEEHYTCLLPADDFTVDTTSLLDGPHVGLRGAAKSVGSASVGTRLSVQKRLKASPVGTRSTVRKQLQNRASSICSFGSRKSLALLKSASTSSSVKRNLNASASSSAPVSSNDFIWICDECQQPLTGTTKAQLSRKRDNHISTRQQGVPRKRFHVLYEPSGIVNTSNHIPWQQGSWECAGCAGILPPLTNRHQKMQSIQKHLTQCPMVGKSNRTASANSLELIKKYGGTRPYVRVLKPGKGGMKKCNLALHKIANQHRELHELQKSTNHVLRRVERDSDSGRAKQEALNVAYTCQTCLQVWKWATYLRIDIEDGSRCNGETGRCANLRSSTTRQFFRKGSPALQRDICKLWGLNAKEKKSFTVKGDALKKLCGRGGPRAEQRDKRRAAVIASRRTARSLWISRHLRMTRKDKLLEEGVEPNPGPHLSLLTLNTAGEDTFWSFLRFLETVTQPPDVIALQELAFAPATVGRAAARAHFLGYRFIFAPPDPSNDGKLRGAGWLVKNTLATIALGNYKDSGGSACLLELHGLVLTSFWRSPSTEDFCRLVALRGICSSGRLPT